MIFSFSLKSAKVVERMLNLNTFGDIALDYRFYEDPSDEFKITEESVEGSLLPLWSFKLEEIGKMEVTGMCWNSQYSDLLGINKIIAMLWLLRSDRDLQESATGRTISTSSPRLATSVSTP